MRPMSLSVRSAAGYPLGELARLLTRSFAGYFVTIRPDVPALANMLRTDGTDLAASQVVLDGDQPVGLAFIARRGWVSRVAAMGVVEEARGRGVGYFLMERLVAQARARHDRLQVLEVIEANEPATRLYQAHGFQPRRRLLGFVAEPWKTAPAAPARAAGESLEVVDPRRVGQAMTRFGSPAAGERGLPWQVAGESLAALAPPFAAFRQGPAWVVVSNPRLNPVQVRGLVVAPEARRQGRATALLGALRARFPRRRFRVPGLTPEGPAAGPFVAAGFQADELSQVEMELPLAEV